MADQDAGQAGSVPGLSCGHEALAMATDGTMCSFWCQLCHMPVEVDPEAGQTPMNRCLFEEIQGRA